MNYYPEYTELTGNLCVGIVLSYIADQDSDEIKITSAKLQEMGIAYSQHKIVRRRLARFEFITEVHDFYGFRYIIDRRKMPNFRVIHDGSVRAMSDENEIILKGHITQMLEIMDIPVNKIYNAANILEFMRENDKDITMIPNKMPKGMRQIIQEYQES